MSNFSSCGENSGFSVMGRDEPESANGGVVDWIGIIITVVALGTAVAIEATRKPGSSSK